MIEYAAISPTTLLRHLCAKPQRMHLVLVQRLECDQVYANYYLKLPQSKSHIIVDNGAHELGESVPDETLFDWIRRLRPTEVVMPDVMQNAGETLLRSFLTWDAVRKRQDVPGFRPLFCPQGRDQDEWLWSLEWTLKSCERSGTLDYGICVPKYTCHWNTPDDGLSRLNLLYHVYANINQGTPVHLLGMDDCLQEPMLLEGKHSWVRSIDSAKPIIYGLKHISLRSYAPPVERTALHRPDDYFDISRVSRLTRSYCKNNIEVVRRWLKRYDAEDDDGEESA